MKSALYQKTIQYMGVKVWNFAMESLQFQCNLFTFKQWLKRDK